MFGLEKEGKKKSQDEFTFDLEAELKEPGYFAKLKKKVEERIQRVKTALRSGESKEDFDRLGLLLHGYTSLLKVINRTRLQK